MGQQVAQKVKALAAKTDDWPQFSLGDPHDRRREQIPVCCPLTAHVCLGISTCTQTCEVHPNTCVENPESRQSLLMLVKHSMKAKVHILKSHIKQQCVHATYVYLLLHATASNLGSCYICCSGITLCKSLHVFSVDGIFQIFISLSPKHSRLFLLAFQDTQYCPYYHI